MTEEELRRLVRQTLVRHLGASSPPGGPAIRPAPVVHDSHALFTLEGDVDGRCLIEPRVQCTHCGYCQSYGH